jgi:hypothetical protein
LKISGHFKSSSGPPPPVVAAGAGRSVVAVNLAAIADRVQVDDVAFPVERVDDSIIAHAQTKAVVPLQSVVRESSDPKAHVINLRFDARLDFGWKFEKGGVESGVLNL